MNMSESEIIQYVKEFADKAHGKQVRKYTGDRYIVHPIRVMEMTRSFNPDTCVHAAALLHDVLEDTPVTAEQIAQALQPVMHNGEVKKVIRLVVELTDIFIADSYPGLNRRSRKEKEAERLSHVSPEAQSIKYADIIDNVKDIVRQDTDFAKVYVQEAKKMLQMMTSGNPQLREMALSLIDKSILNLEKPAALC